MPTIVSESGTALAAPQSIIVTNVLTTNSIPEMKRSPQANESLVICNFWETYRSINQHNYQESYHDAIQFKQEALNLFNLGYLSLEQRATAEELYWGCCQKIVRLLENNDMPPDHKSVLNDYT